MTALPAIIQTVPSSRPYRLFTIEHVPFGHFPTYAEGGPATVSHTKWTTSLTGPATGLYIDEIKGDPRWTVNVHYNPCQMGQVYDPEKTEYHSLDGQKFDTKEEADRAKYEAGLIAYMVYVDTDYVLAEVTT